MKKCSQVDQLGAVVLFKSLRFVALLRSSLDLADNLASRVRVAAAGQLLWHHGVGKRAAVLGELAQTSRAC